MQMDTAATHVHFLPTRVRHRAEKSWTIVAGTEGWIKILGVAFHVRRTDEVNTKSRFGLMYEGYFEPSADTLQMPGLNKNFSELRAPTNGSEKVNDPSHNSCSFSGNEGEAGEQKPLGIACADKRE